MPGKNMRFPDIYEDDYIIQYGGELVDRQIIADQLQKYYGYVAKGRKNPAYELAKETLDRFSEGLDSNVNTLSLVTEMTEIFNMLEEHGFPMGKAQYPGPGADWKKLVDQYLS